tara:strand:+ start:7166 stop:8089 length:924 start_codon:yes stop_codon:yes gene_type:complete
MKLIKPVFWSEKNLLSFLLYPLTLFTFLFNLIKGFSSKKKFFLKTICIGNIYVGGTGKTPLSIKINKILKKKYKTVFIKKKYLNQYDEQKLLEANGNLICTDDRSISLKIAQNQNYDVALIDDGLQEKSIKYDISIACFNSSAGIGNGFLLPSGPLRENISEIKNYDAIFLNGERKNLKLSLLFKNINKDLRIFEAQYVPINIKNFNRKRNFLIFSGIGNPEEFERTLKKNKFKIREKLIYPDHYKFSSADINKIKKIAKNKKLDIITTEKDYYRLNKKNKKNIKFLKIELKIKNIKKFLQFLKESL